MMPTKLNGLSILLALAALSATGCHFDVKCRKDMAKFQGRISQLSAQNVDLQSRLVQAGITEDALTAKLKDSPGRGGRTIAAAGPGRGRQRGAFTETQLNEWRLAGDVVFLPGKASLTAKGKKSLTVIAGELKKSYGGAGKVIRVYGHTDSQPISKSRKLWRDNLDLSANRAMAVSRFLISKGISAGRIETIAMGDASAIASNSTKTGKAQNRRVEIVVIQR